MTGDLPFLSAAGLALLALKTSLILVVAWVITVFAGRRPAAERHFIWQIAMVGVVLLPVLATTPWRLAVRIPVALGFFITERSADISDPDSQRPPAEAALAAAPLSGGASPASQSAADTPESIASVAVVSTEGARTAVGPRAEASTIAPNGPVTEPPRNGMTAEAEALPAANRLWRESPSGSALASSAAAPSEVAGMTTNEPESPYGPAILLLVWASVAAALIARTVGGHVRAFRRAAHAEMLEADEMVSACRRIEKDLGARSVRLLAGARNEMPKAGGFLRPWLLLPPEITDWPRQRQESVLRHEIAHVRRGDTFWEAVVRLACAIHWLNPLIWFAAARLRAEREHACDDIVLLCGTSASDYAADLLSVARQFHSPSRDSVSAIAMARPSRLRTRLMAVLDDRMRSTAAFEGRGGPIAAAGLTLLLGIGILSPAVPTRAAQTEDGAGDAVVDRAGVVERIPWAIAESPDVEPSSLALIDVDAAVDEEADEAVRVDPTSDDAVAPPNDSVVPSSGQESVVVQPPPAGGSSVEATDVQAMRVSYSLTARVLRLDERAPMVPARIVAALRGTSFLERMNVGWGGREGQAQTLTVIFSFPDITAFYEWQASEAGRAFHAAVDEASEVGSVRVSVSAATGR